MNKVYQIVTDKILAALDKGVAPWARPWQTKEPFNAKSGRVYRGMNALLLDISGRGPGFVTVKDAKERGVSFAGVKTELVTFYAKVQGKKKEGDDDFWMLRYYQVLPVSELEGLPDSYYKRNNIEVAQHDTVAEAEAIIAKYLTASGVKLVVGGSRACYVPSADEIRVPERNTFTDIAEYYCSIFHEIMHSTENRIDVRGKYANEELRAEIGACILLAQVGLDHPAVVGNAAAYCKAWAARIRDEKENHVMSAASRAYAGVDFVLGQVTVGEAA